MTFYISPPKGNMSLHRLHSSCCRRLTFLKEVFARGRDLSKLTELTFLCSTVERSDCLIEGSRIDQASHFTLRLACCQDTVMSEFLVEAETTLFWYRFSCMDKNQLLHLFHKIRKYEKRLQDQQAEIGKSRRDLKTEKKLRDLLKVVTGQSGNSSRWENMIQSYLHYFHSQWKHLPDMSANQDEVTQYDRRTDLTTMDCSMHCHTGCHAASRSHTASGDFKVIAQRDTCYATSEEEKIFLKVPFQYTLQLITDRRVCLHKGFAYVPSIYLPNVVANIFEECLRLGIELARKAVPVCLSDPRMRELFGTLQLQFYEDGCRGGEGVGVVFDTISRHDVDRLVDFFPPCMAHLHRTLRYKHRLKHFSRLQYTLFLKDLGLSVHDAVSFWQQEYSKPAHGGGCTHHWAKDGRRYTYNIRHLYGLEGSRVSYRSHCCQGILDRSLQPGEEGGCPFQHFDLTHLQQLLDAEGANTDVRSRLVSMVMDQKPRQACQAYLFHKLQTTYFKSLAGELTYHQEQGTKDAGVEVCLECGGAGSSQQEQCDIHADCTSTGTLQTDSSVTTGCTTCSVRISKPLDFTRALLRLLQGLKDQS